MMNFFFSRFRPATESGHGFRRWMLHLCGRAVAIYRGARLCILDGLRVAPRLAVAGAYFPHRCTGTPRGRIVAKENSYLSIYFVALGFEFNEASKPLFSAQLFHLRSLPTRLVEV